MSDEIKKQVISLLDDLTKNRPFWGPDRLAKLIARGEKLLEILEGE